MAESDTGLLVDCRACKRVMWAGYHPDCPTCRAEKQADALVRDAEQDDEPKPKHNRKGK